jgi:hypothetical protein
MLLVAMKEHNARTLSRMRCTLKEEGAKLMEVLSGILGKDFPATPVSKIKKGIQVPWFTSCRNFFPFVFHICRLYVSAAAVVTSLNSAEYSMCIRPCNKRSQVSFSPCVKLHFSGCESSRVPLDSSVGDSPEGP